MERGALTTRATSLKLRMGKAMPKKNKTTGNPEFTTLRPMAVQIASGGRLALLIIDGVAERKSARKLQHFL